MTTEDIDADRLTGGYQSQTNEAVPDQQSKNIAVDRQRTSVGDCTPASSATTLAVPLQAGRIKDGAVSPDSADLPASPGEEITVAAIYNSESTSGAAPAAQLEAAPGESISHPSPTSTWADHHDAEAGLGRARGGGGGGGDGSCSNTSAIDEPPPPPPPDGGYGWVCVACTFFVNACTWGLNSAYAIYLAYYLSNNLHPSATPYHYAFIGGLSVAVAMTVGPAVTFFYRRGFTTQHIMSLGIVLQCSSLVGASFAVESLPGLFVTQGVLFGLGMGFLYASSFGTISQWFSKKRSVANGISAAGSGVGGVAFTIGLNRAIEDVGVAWSFRITAIVVTAVEIVTTLLIRDRNAAINPTQRSFDFAMLKRIPDFGLVLLWGFFSLLGYIVILFSLADYGRSIGLDASQSSIITAMLSLGMTFGRPCVGLWSDSYGRINISCLMTLLCSVTVFALWLPTGAGGGYGLCIVYAIANGAVCGTFWTTIGPVTTEIVGLKELPSALSIVWLSTVIPTTVSEGIALALRRPELGVLEGGKGGLGPYLYPQVWSGVMYFIAAAVMWVLRARRVGMMIEKERGLGLGQGASGQSGDAAPGEKGGSATGFERKEEDPKLAGGLRLGETGGGKGEKGGKPKTRMVKWRQGGRWWRWVKV